MTTVPRRWLLDLGNTRVKCASLDEQGARGEVTALAHAASDWTQALLQRIGDVDEGDGAWLASVAGDAKTRELVGALTSAGLAVQVVRTVASCGRLRIAYRDPDKLGVDRFLAMLAASERPDGPWLLVSAGSALTVDLLGADGIHHGGLIAAMPDDMRAALARRFVQLDVAGGTVRDFATDTADALASGAVAAMHGVVEHSMANARTRLGDDPTLLACGGRGAELVPAGAARSEFVPWLVLDGLAEFVRLAT